MAKNAVAILLALGAVILAWVVALPRIFRRHRDSLIKLGPFKTFLTRYNALTRDLSGTERSAWGLVTHEGRRSGRTYQTSLGTQPYGDGFLLPLGYGPHTDWYRNIMAAGGCTIAWKGRTYQLERPELLSGPEAMRAWPMRERILLRLAGMREFVWLHQSKETVELPQAQEPAARHAAPMG